MKNGWYLLDHHVKYMMMQVDPNEFIITRKRKKYKFALFANSPICFELEEWDKREVDVLEVGAGTGLFSVELAARSPDKVFVALDVKADRLQKGAKKAEDLGLENIYFVRARADQMNLVVAEGSVQSIWLAFPDPFPKKRSAGRRLTHPTFLNIYLQALRSNGSLLLKHDNLDFFCWSLERLVDTGWILKELSFDLHDSELNNDYKTTTTYEKRWMKEGAKIKFVKAKLK